MTAKCKEGKNFSGLIRYLTNDEHRIDFRASRHLWKEDPRHVRQAMQDLAMAGSHRLEKPLFHLCLNWAPEDQPTNRQTDLRSSR